MGRKKLYLASPLFSNAEKVFNEQLARLLSSSCDVYLPQRDGELIPDLVRQGEPPADAYAAVFARDIRALNDCDGIVICLDGRVIDEGAAFELGYAYAIGKICIGVRTDIRVLLPWGLNPMISVPLTSVFSNFHELKKWAENFAADERAERGHTEVSVLVDA